MTRAAAALLAAGVHADFNLAALATLVAALAAAYVSARLLRYNRRKIIAETTDSATKAIERAARLWQEDNDRLRNEQREDRRLISDLQAENRTLRDRIEALEERETRSQERLTQLLARQRGQ